MSHDQQEARKDYDQLSAELVRKNHELEIEAALERVRVRTMAMHHSDELLEVGGALYRELLNLGIPTLTTGYVLMDKDGIGWNYVVNSKDGTVADKPIGTHHTDFKTMKSVFKSWKKGDPFHAIELNEQETIAHQTYIASYSINFPYTAEQLLSHSPKKLKLYTFHFKEGYLLIVGGDLLTDDQIKILIRFTNVFQQTYTRFLDLQKAEAQAREAEIQLALERVRVKTMAMHRSDELSDAAVVLFEQLGNLKVSPERFVICLIKEDTNELELWATDQDGGRLDQRFSASLDEPTTGKKVHRYWKKGLKSGSIELEGNELDQWVKYVREEVGLKIESVKEKRVHSLAFFTQGVLITTTSEPLTPESLALMERFADVFNLTYTRFLDLQKAEAQAQEARIETALERIRARALAMHSSEELTEVAQVLREQMSKLNQPELSGCVIHLYPEHGETFDSWFAFRPYKQKNIISGQVVFPKDGNSLTRKWIKMYQSDKPEYTIRTTGKEYQEWVKLRNRIMGEKFFQTKSNVKTNFYHMSDFSGGTLITSASVEPADEVKDLQKRAASVFDLAYKRYLDLQAAELREKEAIKQASLDRVRAEIASMRSTKDLERITPLTWKELKILKVPFIRCGVFIIDEANEQVQVYLTTPEGKALAVLQFKMGDNRLTDEAINYWRKRSVYTEHWDKKDFIRWAQSLIQAGQVKDQATYQGDESAPESLYLHFVPFKQGMLYVGNTDPLSERNIEMIKTLADTFSIAYARYEDFQRLENAKLKVEKTLSELRSTQSQLVHAEKMASLGELTAGIAHEIQNPLNFVNNFSELNNELLDDLREAIKNKDQEEIELIYKDLKENESKINHHGKRAEQIVKSMLQHSRSSEGKKEPTNLNALCDEYMRLAYHGFRAKDKSFNAKFKLELDPDLPKVNVIPQDIGRILLNLINNAFQAVAEIENPNVTLNTELLSPVRGGQAKESIPEGGQRGVLITVSDNGPGIPDDIKDKIFQPFFTTKPTGQGTGLGLSMSYDIVTKGHGGSLEVSSNVGKGTKFVIKLPLPR